MIGATQTLDVRPLPHGERLTAILTRWHGLPPGHTLRLVVDHNPVPLQFLLRGQSPGDLRWEYEKEGPEEWIVLITRLASPQASPGAVAGSGDEDGQALKSLLLRLHAGADVTAIKEEAKDLLRGMDASKLALLEQELIVQGIGREEMRRLCDAHLEIMRESLGGQPLTPEPGHPIHTLMEEHRVLKEHLEKLRAYLEAIRQAASFPEVAAELKGTQEVAHHLLEAEKHHQREEDVIFPALEQRGVTEPPAIMRQEHTELRARKAALAEMSREPEGHSYREWVRGLEEVGGYLVRELANHIYKEDHILYQIALQTIAPEAWAEMKARCDRIGYCCFTPGLEAQGAGAYRPADA